MQDQRIQFNTSQSKADSKLFKDLVRKVVSDVQISVRYLLEDISVTKYKVENNEEAFSTEDNPANLWQAGVGGQHGRGLSPPDFNKTLNSQNRNLLNIVERLVNERIH